jgi:uncharacterized protein (DUF736 family)
MENNKQQNDWQKRDIGALWKREGKNQKYLSGYFKDELGEQVEIVIFANKFKNDNPKAPDYRVYLSTKSDGTAKTQAVATTSKVESKAAVKTEKKVVAQVVEEEEDLL